MSIILDNQLLNDFNLKNSEYLVDKKYYIMDDHYELLQEDNNLDYNNFPAKRFLYFFLSLFVINLITSILLTFSLINFPKLIPIILSRIRIRPWQQ